MAENPYETPKEDGGREPLVPAWHVWLALGALAAGMLLALLLNLALPMPLFSFHK